MANLVIASVVDEEAKKEFMKIENPNMTKIRKAANAYEKEGNSAKLHTNTSKAFQIKNTGGRTLSALCVAIRATSPESAPSNETISSAATARGWDISQRSANLSLIVDSNKRISGRTRHEWQKQRDPRDPSQMRRRQASRRRER